MAYGQSGTHTAGGVVVRRVPPNLFKRDIRIPTLERQISNLAHDQSQAIDYFSYEDVSRDFPPSNTGTFVRAKTA